MSKIIIHNNSVKRLQLVAAILILVVLAIWSVIIIITTPVVEFSHSTGECVAVYSHDDSYSCEVLPERFERVVVR
jgi:hypothetical protein